MSKVVRCTEDEWTANGLSTCTREASGFYRDLTDGKLKANCISHNPMSLIATGKLELMTKEEYLVAQVHES